MVQTIQATDISLYDLERKFGLHLAEDEQFFREWVDDLPELTDIEKQQLDRVKASYFNMRCTMNFRCAVQKMNCILF